MVAIVSVRNEFKAFAKQLDRMQRSSLKKATQRAMNLAARKAHTASVRKLAADLSIPSKLVRKQITLRRASLGEIARMKATLRAKGGALKLSAFPYRQGRKGVSVRAWGKRKQYPGTFVAVMKTGHVGIFTRLGDRRGTARRVVAGRWAGKLYKPALKIKELWGPNVPREIAAKVIQQHIAKAFREAFMPELRRQLALLAGPSRRP